MNRIVDRGYTGDMSDQLVDFEESGWRGAKSLRRSRYGANSFLKTKKEVANNYQCKQAQVARLIEYGDINLAQKNGRTELVDTRNSSLIKESIAAWLSLDKTAALLNVSKDCVLQLVETKLLDGRKDRHQRDWLISRKSCDSLVNQLKFKSVVEGNYLVTLKSLQLLPKQNFSQIIKACLDRRIAFRISDYNDPMVSLRVDRRYIQRLLLREKGALLSAMDLTEYLSVNLNAIYYLISKQYINVRSRYCRNRKVYGFYLEDIDEFERKYCFHYEAKSFLLLSGRRDLLPAIKPSNKRCRHRSKVRIYKWQYITSLLNKPSTDSKLTRLFRLEAAAKFVGKSSAQIHSFLEREWIVPYKAPSHHLTGHHFIEFCITDLKRLKVLLDDHPNLMPIRAASKYLGYDRSHIRKQFICSGYLSTKVVPEYPKELFCFKREVFSLKRLLSRTVTGPELSKIMGVTRNTIYKWMKSGKLRPALTPNDEGFGCYRYKIPKNIVGNKGGNSSVQI
jgi:predicted DNA-binding transcriptional regulator AlpA